MEDYLKQIKDLKEKLAKSEKQAQDFRTKYREEKASGQLKPLLIAKGLGPVAAQAIIANWQTEKKIKYDDNDVPTLNYSSLDRGLDDWWNSKEANDWKDVVKQPTKTKQSTAQPSYSQGGETEAFARFIGPGGIDLDE